MTRKTLQLCAFMFSKLTTGGNVHAFTSTHARLESTHTNTFLGDVAGSRPRVDSLWEFVYLQYFNRYGYCCGIAFMQFATSYLTDIQLGLVTPQAEGII